MRATHIIRNSTGRQVLFDRRSVIEKGILQNGPHYSHRLMMLRSVGFIGSVVHNQLFSNLLPFAREHSLHFLTREDERRIGFVLSHGEGLYRSTSETNVLIHFQRPNGALEDGDGEGTER